MESEHLHGSPWKFPAIDQVGRALDYTVADRDVELNGCVEVTVGVRPYAALVTAVHGELTGEVTLAS
jgi:hypothetical protein